MSDVRTPPQVPAWRSWPGAVAAALLAGQFFWRGHYLWDGFFMEDDFKLLRLGSENGLTWSYLMQEYAGHVWPGNFLMAWWTARLDPGSWTVAATSILLIQLAAGVMMWLVLCRISDDWRIRIPVLTAYLVSPLTIWASQWWASAIGFMPLSFFMLLAVWALVRHIQEGWRPGPLVMTLACLAGLASLERALLYTLVLGGVAVVMGQGGFLTRVRTALRTYWVAWVCVVVAVGGWLAVRSTITQVDVSGGGADRDVFQLLTDFFFRSLLPGMAGGPWGGTERVGGALVPTTAAAVIGSSVTLLALAWVVWRSRTSGRLAVVVIFLYALADLALIFGGRIQFDGRFGLVPRYMADVTPVACVFVAFALADLSRSSATRARVDRIQRVVSTTPLVVGLTLAYAASSVWTTAVIAPLELGSESRAYVGTLRASVEAHPEAVLYDRGVPTGVMSPLFEEYGRVSTVLATAPERPVFGIPSEELLLPGATGELEEIDFWVGQRMHPDPDLGDCGYRLARGRPAVVVPAEDADGLPDQWVVRIGYFASTDTLVTVRLDGGTQSFLAREGAREVFVVVDGPTHELVLESLRDSGTVCVTDLEAGLPRQVF